jgi:geranylgeranyl reductase family protein
VLSSYDILIVGAGPAGCAAAYDLARAGKRVLLLDKRNFPRHKACACGLTRKTLDALRYSVDPVVERVCHEIVLQQNSAVAKHREVRVRTRNPICAMAVRERFDKFCLQQTLVAGRDGGSVTLRKIEGIAAVREFAAHVEVDIATSEGAETLRAAVVIGADGSNGQMRRLVQGHDGAEPEWYTKGFALEAMIPFAMLPAALPQGDARHDLVFDFAPLPGGYGWLFPKGDHINIGVGAFAPSDDASDARLKQVTRALLAEYTRHKLGVDIAAVGAQVTGQYLGMGGTAYVPRGRVLLVGDAAGLVDPLTGEGIHSALVSGQAAATAVLRGESDVAAAYARELRPLQETLAFSDRAARAFYAEPERGFRVMRTPVLRGLVLKTYADGLPHTKLLGRLARVVA